MTTLMDKRYQVFVSSTYEDLRAERQEVMQALLELDCIPAGMELFPAADDEVWALIKRVIDESDYYIIVIAGKYGSLHPSGKSFTQLEYEYAVAQGKPVLGFVHESPSSLSLAVSETSPDLKTKFEDFRTLVRGKFCKKWSSRENLGAVVSRGVAALIKTRPATGWVRANSVEINGLSKWRTDGESSENDPIKPDWQLSAQSFLSHLGKVIPHREEAQIGGRFRDSHEPINFIAQQLLDHYWEGYQIAVESAGHRWPTLPLENGPRMLAAVTAVDRAQQSVRAVSVHNIDGWTYDHRYITAKANAAARKLAHGVQRVIITSDTSQVEDPQFKGILHTELEAGVEIRYLTKSEIEEMRRRGEIPQNLNIRNVLIVDECIMSRSHPDRTDGELVTNPRFIKDELLSFDAFWTKAKSIR